MAQNILKIWITFYDASTAVLKYRIGLVNQTETYWGDLNPEPGEQTVDSEETGNPGYEILLPTDESDTPADAYGLMSISTLGYNFDLTGGPITDIVIDVKEMQGGNGSGDFSIYHSDSNSEATDENNRLFKDLYAEFSYVGIEQDHTESLPGGKSYVHISNVHEAGNTAIVGYHNDNLLSGYSEPKIKAGDYENNPLNTKFMIYYENGLGRDLVLATSITNCLASWTPIPKIVPVNSLQVGDLVRTNVGDQPISKILKSNHLTGVREYVIFEQNCFGNNLPSQSIYLTGCHPLSIGYFKVEDINDGKEDPEQDEKVFVHIAAKSLVDKLPGICKKVVEDNANYNLIFDQHCSIDIGGLDVVMHHAVGNSKFPNPRLSEHEFQNPEKATKKGDKPFYIKYKDLLKYKPEDMDLKDFLGKCFVYDIDKKFNFGTIKADDNQFKDRFNY